jgi:hypothetical protein
MKTSKHIAGVGNFAGALAISATWMFANPARADDTIKIPGAHPDYNFEVEPHLLVGWDTYAAGGIGAGVRFGIPIVSNGFVPSINNSVAITFGADLIHYDGCYFGVCSTSALDFPVALQWNFYVAKQWSVFGEPGIVVHGFVGGCPVDQACVDVWPSFFVGARYRITDKVALTMRVGFPSFSFGVSFFP